MSTGAMSTHSENGTNPTLDLLVRRASCRRFADREIPADILRQVLDAGIRAPTGGNLQPYSIIQIERPETKRELAHLCYDQQFMAGAPVILLFCIDWHRLGRWARLMKAPFTATSSFRMFWISIQDTVISAQSMCMAAESLGLGSVYIGSVLECLPQLRDMFDLPDGVFPVVLLCLGYPETTLRPAAKLPSELIVHKERYRHVDDQTLLAALDEKFHDKQCEITATRLETIRDVCREVHGEAFAEECLETIRAAGRINAAQFFFALHYSAARIPQGNEKFLELMERFGFDWFKEYIPSV